MSQKPSFSNNSPIDVVIAWVDGDDPILAAKRNTYLNNGNVTIKSGAHPTRFASVNEITYCVLSIFRFAPFIRNVFIVTDGQDPNIWEDIKTHFPHRLSSIKIVDHTEIFEGFEQCLPTFNSIAIGNMIWRVKGISDNFVYFNDDIFLIRAVKPEDFFINSRPVLRGKWTPAPILRLFWDHVKRFANSFVLGNRKYQPRASFHIGQWNSAYIAGFRWRYLGNSHTPHTVGRQIVVDFFNSNKSLFEKNISYRFREYSQFTFIALSNHLQILSGNRTIAKPDLAYLQPFNRTKGYIDKKIKFCENQSNIKFLCVQSMDLCTKEDQEKILGWLEAILGLDVSGISQKDKTPNPL
jgi:hypothetical protein